MVKDVVWQQFLLFCHRNGLYYGKQLDDTATLCWSNSENDDGCKVVRSLNKLDRCSNDSTAHGVANAKAVPSSIVAGQKFMVVSSLERYLRK